MAGRATTERIRASYGYICSRTGMVTRVHLWYAAAVVLFEMERTAVLLRLQYRYIHLPTVHATRTVLTAVYLYTCRGSQYDFSCLGEL